VVALGWYSNNSTLIQIHPSLVPMEFNTALGLMLSGLLVLLPASAPKLPRIGAAGILTTLGTVTLAEYSLGFDSGLKQLFLQHLNPNTGMQPGQMAPDTAFSFAFMGASLTLCPLCSSRTVEKLRAATGSILIGTAIVGLLGYWMRLDTEFLWGNSARMAAHTAAGFSLLGTGMLASAWPAEQPRSPWDIHWLPVAAGVGILTINVTLWHALNPQQSPDAIRFGKGLLLFFGTASALVLGRAVAYAQRARASAATTRRAHRVLQHEIDARRKAEQAHQNSEAQLRQAQKLEAVGQLTGGIAHDFNNMLSIVSGNLELLQSRPSVDSKSAEYLHKAMQGVQRGAALTRKLLAFSRQQVLQPKVMDINETLDGMTEWLQRTLGETIRVETACNADLWKCQVDPVQLENALLNLSLNARDAMPGGGILTLEAGNVHLDEDSAERHADSKPGQYVMLAVSDNGAGMSEATRKRAFEPFFTTKEAGKGSGLGLSMVHGFAKQSGGWINIYSEPGNGTSIKLYFPRYRGVEPEVTEPPATSVELGGDETVLVVEDESALLQTIVAQLRQLGYTVRAAHDMTSALAVFSGSPGIDLLLTDVVLPGGNNGRDVARTLLAQQAKLKVLYMSGYTKNAIDHHGRLDDDVMLLAKPFTREELGRMIRHLLDGKQQLRHERT